ncbi:MAG: (d)CMP kinase [Candidatus Omnitrophica bacterium]|nr:(d)CMP kinase [Candidatus Omnitrophota bacterium]
MGNTKVITIDGPAGAGKSTVAKALAHRLKFSYLDTGAMYRALTLKALREDVNLESEEDLVALANKTTIDLQGDTTAGLKVFLDEQDVSEEIRTIEVTNNTFYIARAPKVREIMVEMQRAIGTKKNIVVEGRDVGTVVFPDATNKFYLDANFEERAQRRIKELEEKGKDVEAEKLKAELQDRDNKDFTRKAGPLKKADDAVVIDSTPLSIDGVVDEMMKYIKNG